AAGTNYFNGNVGLGTSTIANKLDVNGAASIGYPGIAGPTNGLLVNGNVGLGTAASYNPLTVVGNSTLTSSSYTAINLYGNQTVASTGNYYSVVASPAFTAASGNTLNYLYGITSGAYNASTGTITNLMGMYTAPNNASSGTVTTMYGLYAAPANNSAGDASGTVTTLVGVLGRPYNASHLATSINAMYGVQGTPTNNYTGTVNYMYGLYSQCVNSWTGTVSNCYALYLDTPNNGGTITNRFGVYQVDTASPNYFAGKIGIGSTTPVSSLDLNMQTDALALPVGTTGQRPGVPVNGMMRYNNSTSPPQLEAYANNAWTQIFTGNNAQWSTNGTSIYYNGGNVGIGTNNPLNKLDVAGGVVIGTANAGIKTAPTNGLLVQGNVGLGITTSPTQMVELGSSAPGAIGPVVKLRNTGNSTSDQAYVDFATGSATDTSEVRARIGMNVLTGGQGQFDIYTKSTATTFGAAPDMRIVSGKVGIGTATVGAGLLTIGSTAGTSGSIVLNGSTSGNATIQVPAVAGTGTLFQLPATNGNNGYVLQTDGTGVTTWTNTPAGLITTLGTSTGAANPRISGDATSGFYTAGAGLVDVTISSTKRVEWSSTGEAVTGQMSTTGSVGVGTSTIANKLDVNGSASIGYVNTAAPSNGLLVSGSVGIGSASPTYTLDMATSSTSGLRIRNGTATSAAGMAIANDGTNGLSFASYGSTYSAGSIFSVGAGGSGISSSGGSFGIGTGDSNNFYLGTSNSPRMTIASSGRIGIGTTSPSYVLDILSTTTNSFRVNNTSSTSASTMQFTNDQNNGLGIAAYGSTYSAGSVFSIGANGTGLTSTGGTFGLGTYDSNNLLLGTNNTVRMTILSGGNVGIGTATVANKLDVNGAASIGYINTAAPSNGLIVSGQMGVGTATSLGGAQLSVVGNTIYTATVSTTDVFPTLGKQPLMALVGAGTVNGNPNIGLLQVNIGSSNVYQSASEIYLAATRGLTANTRSAVANTDILGQVGFFGDDGTNVRTRGAMIQSFVDTSVDPVATGNIPARLVLATEMHAPIVFNTNAGTLSADVTTNERMRIDGYGNVGIGSTAPATLLDVNGAATIRGNLTVTGTVTGGAVSVTLGTSAASPTPSRSGESNTGLFSPTSGAVAVSSLSNEMMRVNATGVGIGTTTIANKLDV
ncbi:MAG: hypothetical protein JO253_05015, partial [Alphaproteobacteria bacterium]|nr:hypothetical protein [Alphaproteobacteria bacterium]